MELFPTHIPPVSKLQVSIKDWTGGYVGFVSIPAFYATRKGGDLEESCRRVSGTAL